MLSTNTIATVLVVNGWESGIKCAYFVSLSTTTRIEDLHILLGSPSIKSIKISSHTCSGMGKGWSSPAGNVFSYFDLWQGSHCLIYSLTLPFMPFQYAIFFNLCRVFLYPECPPVGVSWCSEINNLVTPRSHGYKDVTATYIRRSKIPSPIYAKHQYMKESEHESMWCIIHSNIWVQLQSYHRMWYNITRILQH